ncbi:MAG: branched-chain amino acid ABC transporter substrate-binding protein, partial [Thermoleophilaceae bacterium]|nr:branched-chain amino acid ABC transporter substrate-binding protein [Thermoleophilaceae bacterium]
MALAAGACGDEEDGGGGETAQGETLNVYSSLPLQGASRPQTTAMVDGIRLAVKQHDGRAGPYRIKYLSLDDSTAQAGTWTPEATSANARKAAQDDKAIAYIGEFNSGASAISIPILNEVPLAQVSPANTAVGLTSDGPGADKGEPEKYYPTGERHYLRIVPKDTIQGAALATVMSEDGCRNVAILHDKEVYGAGLARNIENSAAELGLNVVTNEGIDPRAPNYRALAASLRQDGAGCFVFSGITANGAVQLYKDVAAALPEAGLYGPDGVAESGFADPAEGGIPPSVAERVKVTVATLAPDEYPPEGRRFFREFRQTYGEQNPDPYAIYGYEAMDLILDTCDKLGERCSDRQPMIDALFDTKGRRSVLGTYDIDENGDTTLTDYGVYRIEGGELVFDQTVQAKAEPGGDAPGGGTGPP